MLSDMSVFHRVDDLDQLPAAQFFPRMVRLPMYDGAVRFALVNETRVPQQQQVLPPAAEKQAPPVNAYSRDELAALNNTKLGGSMGVNQAAVFDVG